MPVEQETLAGPPALAEPAAGAAPADADAGADAGRARPGAPPAPAPVRKDEPQRYDFRQTAFVSSTELRKLRQQQEEFVRGLAAQLSIYLRLEFGLSLTHLHTLPYRKFTEGLGHPTCVTLFKLEPLRGIGLLEMEPKLALCIADRLMGGPAIPLNAEREPSDIELVLLDQVVELMLREWGDQWARVQELRPVLLGHENCGTFLHTSPHDAAVSVLGLEGRVGEIAGRMQLALPLATLDPLLRHLRQRIETDTQESARRPGAEVKWNPLFDDVALPLTAELHSLQLTAREVAHLSAGDVIELDPAAAQKVTLRVGSLPRFAGRLGTLRNKWAVEVTEVLPR